MVLAFGCFLFFVAVSVVFGFVGRFEGMRLCVGAVWGLGGLGWVMVNGGMLWILWSGTVYAVNCVKLKCIFR